MPEHGEPLSKREMEVLQAVLEGSANKQIAVELGISQNTIKVHLRNIYTKLGVASRTEAVTEAMRQGILTVPGDIASAEAPAIDGSDHTPVSTTIEADVPGADATPGTLLNRPARMLLVLFLLVVVVLVTFFNLQTANNQPAPTAEPFVVTDLGDRWSTIPPMPGVRANMALTAFGLNLYQIGGDTADSVTGAVLVYNTKTLTWEEAAAKPTAVADITAAELFGEIYVPGGRLASGQPTNIVEAYSPASDRWRIVQSLPHPVAGGLTLSDGSFLYLFGGWDGDQYLDTAYIYDPGANSWRPLPPMSQARAFMAGAVITGHLYAVGGSNGAEALSTCEYFDPASEMWSPCPDMLHPRAGAGAAGLVNELYVIGGGRDSDSAAPFGESYDPTTGKWALVNTPMLSDEPSWSDLGVTNIETRLFALGGYRGQETPVTDAFVYAPLVYQTFIPAASSGGE